MSRSRFGGFRKGKKRYFNNWSILKSEDVAAPETVANLDYSKAKGIWNLKSTTQFPKSQVTAQPLGLSSSLLQLTSTSASWTQRSVDLTDYAGHEVRLVWRVVIGTTGNVYENDVQLDTISVDGNSYNFDSTTESFETTTNGSDSTYSTASFSALGTGTTAEQWNRNTGATASGGTGSLTAQSGSYYVYTETSSPVVNGDVFWLRSPAITLSSSPGSCTFYEGRDVTGATTTLDFYVDVVTQP